ncbi:MAG: cation transporter [Bacteroidetes bacterium]|nr:cation transporter [Bacteroidota bacterium]MBL6943688.1 cation transporter [Bacteroidales bacterium]
MSIGLREQKIIKASWIAVFGNGVLSILKIVVGIIAGSFSVIADGIDSASDVLTSLITLFTAHIISRPPDIKYSYGYNKADSIATKILAFIIFFAGAQLAISTSDRLLNPIETEIPDTIAIYVIILSIIGKYALSFYLSKTGKLTNSPMLIANARNMQNDVIISLSVLTGLVFTFVFELPIIDLITAFLVSFYIMYIAFKIFMQSNRDLMDGIDDPEIYQKIIATVKSIKGVSNPHRIRVRKMAHQYLVALDIEVDGNITLNEAHNLSSLVEDEIKKTIPNIYDVLVHSEPVGNDEPNEAYGVSEDKLNG